MQLTKVLHVLTTTNIEGEFNCEVWRNYPAETFTGLAAKMYAEKVVPLGGVGPSIFGSNSLAA